MRAVGVAVCVWVKAVSVSVKPSDGIGEDVTELDVTERARDETRGKSSLKARLIPRYYPFKPANPIAPLWDRGKGKISLM